MDFYAVWWSWVMSQKALAEGQAALRKPVNLIWQGSASSPTSDTVPLGPLDFSFLGSGTPRPPSPSWKVPLRIKPKTGGSYWQTWEKPRTNGGSRCSKIWLSCVMLKGSPRGPGCGGGRGVLTSTCEGLLEQSYPSSRRERHSASVRGRVAPWIRTK